MQQDPEAANRPEQSQRVNAISDDDLEPIEPIGTGDVNVVNAVRACLVR